MLSASGVIYSNSRKAYPFFIMDNTIHKLPIIKRMFITTSTRSYFSVLKFRCHVQYLIHEKYLHSHITFNRNVGTGFPFSLSQNANNPLDSINVNGKYSFSYITRN